MFDQWNWLEKWLQRKSSSESFNFPEIWLLWNFDQKNKTLCVFGFFEEKLGNWGTDLENLERFSLPGFFYMIIKISDRSKVRLLYKSIKLNIFSIWSDFSTLCPRWVNETHTETHKWNKKVQRSTPINQINIIFEIQRIWMTDNDVLSSSIIYPWYHLIKFADKFCLTSHFADKKRNTIEFPRRLMCQCTQTKNILLSYRWVNNKFFLLPFEV